MTTPRATPFDNAFRGAVVAMILLLVASLFALVIGLSPPPEGYELSLTIWSACLGSAVGVVVGWSK